MAKPRLRLVRYELLDTPEKVEWANLHTSHRFKYKLGDNIPERESEALRKEFGLPAEPESCG